jgi:DNA-binding beta-propeller fold protein YncE
VARPELTGLSPHRAVAGGRVRLSLTGLDVEAVALPLVRVGDDSVRAAFAAPTSVAFVVPPETAAGHVPLRLDAVPGQAVFLDIGGPIATGVHQVDSPAVDAAGNVYATCSGSRGQQSAVSVYRIGPDGIRDVFVTGLTNATSLALDPQGRLHVTSRFDGTVARIGADGRPETIASELGVATGLAFDPDGVLYVGDRSGTIFRMAHGGPPTAFASLPPSVAAYHLAWHPVDSALYVTGPTISTRDRVYRIGRQGDIRVVYEGFGRPQGLAVDTDGSLLVAEALAGASGIYRLRLGEPEPELLISGPALVGIAVHPRGGYVVATADAIYRC